MSKKVIFISWAPYCSRSDNIAREFGGKSYLVYFEFLGSHYTTIFFKYFLQALKTLFILLKDMPDIVFVMTPSVFACIPVWLYCKVFNRKYIIDAHSGALINPMWKRVMFLHVFFSRHAVTTVVTNEFLESMVRDSFGAEASIIRDVPVKYEGGKSVRSDGRFTLTYINTFADDEPLETLLSAAGGIDNINLYITGKLKYSKYPKSLINGVPSHIKFTDFLSDADYSALLKSSDAIIVLTLKDHTMQRGAYEAIYQNKPVIISDWGILRDSFQKGAVFVNNTPESIADGITRMKNNLKKYTDGALELRHEKLKKWDENRAIIIDLLQK